MEVTVIEREGKEPKVALMLQGLEPSAIVSGLITLLSQGNSLNGNAIMASIAIAKDPREIRCVLEACLPCPKHNSKQTQELFAPIPGMIISLLQHCQVRDMQIKY